MPRCLRILCAALLLTCISAGARAGGGEGYSGGGGGGDSYDGGGGGFSWDGGPSVGDGIDIVSSLPVSGKAKLFLLALILVALYLLKRRHGGPARSFRASLDPALQSDIRGGGAEPSPAVAALKDKLDGLFVAVQKAWDGGDMEPVRAVISDGVYHRFRLQLDMNRRQGVRNRVEDPALLEARLLKEERFGRYLSADFLVRGSVADSDVRIDTGARIRGGGQSAFTEIWSFARSTAAPDGEALRSLANCPKCAGPLSDAGGTRCSHCGSVLNSGAYDWVLAEITQAVEWAGGDRTGLDRYYARLPAPVASAPKEWLAPQELEDRASVVFIRYQDALHQGSLASLAAFADPDLLASLGRDRRDRPLFRLAVGTVDLRGFAAFDGVVKAFVRVRFSGAESAGQDGMNRERIMVFRKSLDAGAGKAGLSSLSCSACGGPLAATDQSACAYCGAPLSGPASTWTWCAYGGQELMTQLAEAVPHMAANGAGAASARPVSAAHPAAASASAGASAAGTQVRLLSAMASAALEDRAMTASEEATLREFARHFGLGALMVDMILRKARTNPEALDGAIDQKEAVRWLNNFILVAAMDGRITPEEEGILASFARKNGIDERNTRYALKAALKTKA